MDPGGAEGHITTELIKQCLTQVMHLTGLVQINAITSNLPALPDEKSEKDDHLPRA
jgi:hypothetical protein